jgi:hypothetical protein
MRFTKACIPLGAAWSSPFARWQGPLAEVNSLDLAVDVAMRAMAARGIDASILTRLVLGWTVPHEASFSARPPWPRGLALRVSAGPRSPRPVPPRQCASKPPRRASNPGMAG